MLARSILRLIFPFCTKIPPLQPSSLHSLTPKPQSHRYKHSKHSALTSTLSTTQQSPPVKLTFKIKLNKINDANYFNQIINNQHNLKETNKLLWAVVKGGLGNKTGFQNLFKKYCYYIQKIPEKSGYLQANLDAKVDFLNAVTEVYKRYGRLANKSMIKTFNFASNQLYYAFSKHLQNPSKQKQLSSYLKNTILTLASISRYNPKKSIALFKQIQHKLINPKILSIINKQIAILYLQFCNNVFMFNRLITQTCIDALSSEIQGLNNDQFQQILYSLASSSYPINHNFVLKLVARVKKQFSRRIDPHSGIAHQKNNLQLRQQIRILQSLSLIEQNMNLASAYLPQLGAIFQVQIQEFGQYLDKMTDRDLLNFCQLLRRSASYDSTILQHMVKQLLIRPVKQLQQLQAEHTSTQSSQNKKSMAISINTLCSALHTLATLSYRSQAFIQYFIRVAILLVNKQQIIDKVAESKDIVIKDQNSDNNNSNSKLMYLEHIVQPKYYSRVIWSMCVLANKQQLLQIYPIFSNFFTSQSNISPRMHQSLNFYYCYLLLKTYFPKSSTKFSSSFSFSNLLPKVQSHLSSQTLQSQISKTHNTVYKQFLDSGIAALKQHNISNLMCDIFIPKYISKNNKYIVQNIIIDVHGLHHFMRNCDIVKGSNMLKSKILESQGYVYQYISVHQWALIQDKQQYISIVMETIAQKYGKLITQSSRNALLNSKNNTNTRQLINNNNSNIPQQSINIETHSQPAQQTPRINTSLRRGGRSIKTNSAKLQNRLQNNE